MVSLAELTGKLDTTKIRVIEGDIPTGDWIFNGHGMVLTPPKEPVAAQTTECNGGSTTSEKVIVALDGHVRVIPRRAEEFGPLRQFASDLTPLGGALAGAVIGAGSPFGFFAMMMGFSAGHMIGRNVATFTCELDDGRKFNAMADYKIFRRIQSIARS